MDVLLVSPASSGHVTIAKALTGLFYCLLCIGIAFAINSALIYNWPLAILTAVCGALLTVSIGLLLGTIIESRQQLMLWGWVFLIPLMLPTLLSIMDDLLPANVITVFRWVPTTALFWVFRVSFSNQANYWLYGLPLLWIALWSVVGFGLVAWLVRRMDR